MKKFFTFFLMIISSYSFAQWVEKTGNIPIGDQYGMAIYGIDKVCFAGETGGYISTDLGVNWTKVVDAGNYYVKAVAMNLSTGDVYFCKDKTLDTCYILKTTDNGLTFSTLLRKKSADFRELVITDSGTVLAFGTGMLYRSTDESTWSETALLNYNAAMVKVYGSTVLLAGTGDEGGLYISTDDGLTFNKKAISSSIKTLHSVCKAPDGAIYVGAYSTGSTKGRIYKTNDLGLNWTNVYTTTSDSTPIYDIEVLSDGKIFACMKSGGVVYSGDVGNLWMDVSYTNFGPMEICEGPNGKIWAIKDSKLAYLDIVSDVDNLLVAKSMAIFPNPTSRLLNINFKIPTEGYKIFDVVGNDIMQSSDKQVDVSMFANGIYFIKAENQVVRFIKE